MKDLTTVRSCHFYLLRLQHNMPPSPTPAAASEPRHWNTSLVALVGVVCALFLLLCCYKVLQRDWCAFHGLTFSRSRVQSRRLNEENQDDPSLQFQSRGLDYLVMHSLPITQFEKKKEESDQLGQSNTECAVCLGEFEEGEWLKHLPNCSHAFHVSCIDTWFQTHSSCPLCRSFVNDLAMDHECSISMDTLLETLQREDFLQDRSSHYQVFRSHILQNSPLTMDP